MPSLSHASAAGAIRAILAMGTPMSSAELARRVGVSQPTASRTLNGILSEETVRLGAGRSARFALLNRLGRHGHSWLLFRVGEDGTRCPLGKISALAGDNWFIRFAEHEPLYSRGLDHGYCEGWPWFLATLRPEGHLGRQFARRVGRIIGASPNLNEWRPADFLLGALLFGADFPGNLVLGEHEACAAPEIAEDEWPAMVRASFEEGEAGAIFVGSASVGGERAKFATGNEIVKYSGRSGSGRWGDLLVAEVLASEVLRDHGVDAALARLVEREGIVFHASERFDRTGAGGRRAVHSLRAVDDGLFGTADTSWPALAERLRSERLLGDSDVRTIGFLWNFGRLIGNNDMHTRVLVPAPSRARTPACLPSGRGLSEQGLWNETFAGFRCG